MERVGFTRIVRLLPSVASFLAGGLLFSFICWQCDWNVFNDSDDSHVHEFHTRTEYTIRAIPFALPPVAVPVIAGKPLDSAQQRLLSHSRHSKNSIEGRNPSVGLKAHNTSSERLDLGSHAVPVEPCPDNSRVIDTTISVPFAQSVILPDTSFSLVQQARYHFHWIQDCFNGGARDFQFVPSPVMAITIDRKTTETIIKRTWLRIAPYGYVDPYDMKDWQVGARAEIRFDDLWPFAEAVYDGKLRKHIGASYDLFTLER